MTNLHNICIRLFKHYFIVLALIMMQNADGQFNTIIGCVENPYGYSCGFNGPSGIAITPDGEKAYVCNYNVGTGTTVSVIDLSQGVIIDCVEVPSPYSSLCPLHGPWCVAVTPDGTKAYVGCFNNVPEYAVLVIDVATDTVIACVGMFNLLIQLHVHLVSLKL